MRRKRDASLGGRAGARLDRRRIVAFAAIIVFLVPLLVAILWRAPAGLPAAAGVPVPRNGEANGKGAYRLNKGVTTAFEPLPATRCATPTAADCIRAVYLGAPGDYAQVQDIPADKLLSPDADGRYRVERGQQITVVTAAALPSGWTRFYLERTPDQVTVSPTSYERLLPPVGTTYTFTVNADERGANLITFDLHAARPLPVQRPGVKPELGDVIVSTEFLLHRVRYNMLDGTGAPRTAGSYSFLTTAGTASSAKSTVYRYARDFTELRVNTSDALGVSRSAFYDTIVVGDKLDFRTSEDDCGYRYVVESIDTSGAYQSFGIKYISGFGLRCGVEVGEVDFVWKVAAGVAASSGLQLLLHNEPTGPGTYQLTPGYAWVIDVPAGSEIIYGGFYDSEHTDEPGAPTSGVVLMDAETRAVLHIDPVTGREIVRRGATTSETNSLFNDILASMRIPE